MAKNEKTSPKVATIASKVMQNKFVPKKDLKSLAASALTQAADKKKGKK